MEIKKEIRGGIYLVIDPSMERSLLLDKLKRLVHEDIGAIQIWDNFAAGTEPVPIVNEILDLFHPTNTPVIINNRWELLKQTDIDGVHFDRMQDSLPQIKKELGRTIITGITCGNDLSVVKWATENALDYLSFCSMFPSSTANSCELVSFSTIKEVKKMTEIPVFLAGGIQPEHINILKNLDYAGIAVISGIMNADNPVEALTKYQQQIKNKSK